MIVTLIAAIILITPIQYNFENSAYDRILDQAIYDCKNTGPENVDRELLSSLLLVEAGYNVPDGLRGMLLASACYESGYNPKARGDRKFSEDKISPKAIGLFQMWPWWEQKRYGYGIDREDPMAAASAYMKHIIKQIPRVKKRCGYKSAKKIWIAAWVHAIRKPKDGGRCKEKPKHLRVLKRWHQNIASSMERPGFTRK